VPKSRLLHGHAERLLQGRQAANTVVANQHQWPLARTFGEAGHAIERDHEWPHPHCRRRFARLGHDGVRHVIAQADETERNMKPTQIERFGSQPITGTDAASKPPDSGFGIRIRLHFEEHTI
jgi:hypothetical protein